MSEKKCLVILISYLKRVGSSTETFSLSLPAIWISNIREMLSFPEATWGALGKASFCRSSADGEAGETLCRASQRDPTNYLLAAALTIALWTHVVGMIDTVVLVSLQLPILPRKADLGRIMSESNTGSGKPGLGQGLMTGIQHPALPALPARPETCQKGGCTARTLPFVHRQLRREPCSESWKQKWGQLQ